MRKSEVEMPKDIKKRCHKTIHSASSAAAAAGAIPIPVSDALPITAAQIAMVISLGKVFGMTLSKSTADLVTKLVITQQAGRAIAANILKAIPGAGTVAGCVIGGSTAAALTEALGWLVADDFYRMANGEEAKNIIGTADELKGAFDGLRMSKGN